MSGSRRGADTGFSVQRWWRGEAGGAGALLNVLLLPAELAFATAARARAAAYDGGVLATQRATIPVVSVGNIAVGGAGKTPVAAFVAGRLAEMGHRPALLHGGYAADEPALHRQWHPAIPVIVGRDRVASAEVAAAGGATVVVLDDGFQHRRLARDVDLVLVAAETWTHEPRLLPRGPWREPPAALRRASAIIVTERTAAAGAQRAALRGDLQVIAPGVPICTAVLRPSRWYHEAQHAAPPTAPAIAVAAIAHPELFVSSARTAGANVQALVAFRDHHEYREEDAERIRGCAAGRPIVTTAKDWVKLEALLDPEMVWVLEQDVVIEEGDAVLDSLLASLPRSA